MTYDNAYDGYDPSDSVAAPHDESFDVAGRWIAKPEEDHTLIDAELHDAHLITSMPEDGDHSYMLPVIDLDVPCRLIPSSTEGHFHLYIDQQVPAVAFWNMLDAMADAGLVEPGYVSASREREFTAVRLPWIKKATTTREKDCNV